eukprot:COSAG01_NODE_72967_length_251_cov_1.105263_1_plen_62_part_10
MIKDTHLPCGAAPQVACAQPPGSGKPPPTRAHTAAGGRSADHHHPRQAERVEGWVGEQERRW